MKKLVKRNCNCSRLGTNSDCNENLIACTSCGHREYFNDKEENLKFCNHILSNLSIFKCDEEKNKI